MYKSKLQEFCHKKRWSLPKYSAVNGGPVHKPSFKGSVFVNGVTFHSCDTFSSSKEAHNQAAKFAFLNFTSPPLDLGSSSPPDEHYSKEEVEAAKPQESPIPPISSDIKRDTDRSSKLQLQNYARNNDLEPPVFTIKSEGLPHYMQYKATVVIDGKSFESPTFFNNRKDAEHAAAKVALKELPITVDFFLKGQSCSSKSLLLDLTVREGFGQPSYKTTQIGSSHIPTFFSTAEVEGVEFHGKASSSKKLAEQDAAKIAYIALKECGLHMYAAFSSSIKENQPVESDIVKSKQKLNSEDEGLDEEIFPMKKMKMSNNNISSFSTKSSPLSDTDLSCVTISESNKAKTPNTSSYLLCNRFKVYTSFPDIKFPEGITVLPIGDSKWVAVSLEFPNDKSF